MPITEGDSTFYSFEREPRLDQAKARIPTDSSILVTDTNTIPWFEKSSKSSTILNNGASDTVKFRIRIPDSSVVDLSSYYIVFETTGYNILDATGVRSQSRLWLEYGGKSDQ